VLQLRKARGLTLLELYRIGFSLTRCKDVSRQLAARAASRTGISEDVVKRLLPVVAAMAMGVLSKRTSSGVTTPSASAAR